MERRRVRIGRWLALLGTVALAGAVVAPAAGAGGGDQQFPAVDQPGVTDSEIRVGGVATITGDPTGNKLGTAFDGVEAYFDFINKTEGGLYGRKLVLDSKRDDQLANNRQEVQGLLDDDVFAVLPVAVDLFTGAPLLVDNKIPTFGWDIQAEWGSETNTPGPANLFGAAGSFINFKTPGPSNYLTAWLAKKTGVENLGVIAYSVEQSADCAAAIGQALDKFPVAKVAFEDTTVPFGNADWSAQVARMAEENVDLVVPCLDANGAITLAREMKKQGLEAPEVLPNAYNPELVSQNAQFLDGSYLFTLFTPLEVKPQPPGLKLYQKWIKKSGGTKSENSIYGWLNADLFVTGLKAAGPDFTRQKVVDAINQITDYDANGILAGVDWTKAHEEAPSCYAWLKIVDGRFQPVFGKPGKPFVCIPQDTTKIPKNPEVVG